MIFFVGLLNFGVSDLGNYELIGLISDFHDSKLPRLIFKKKYFTLW